MKPIGAGGKPKSQVSRLCSEFDIQVNALLPRRSKSKWPYLWLDATYLMVREGRRIIRRSVTMTLAVNDAGKREVLGVATGASEAEMASTGHLRSLADRGLRSVKLVMADEHKGLRGVARQVSNVTRQKCQFHWMRNELAQALEVVQKGDVRQAADLVQQGEKTDFPLGLGGISYCAPLNALAVLTQRRVGIAQAGRALAEPGWHRRSALTVLPENRHVSSQFLVGDGFAYQPGTAI